MEAIKIQKDLDLRLINESDAGELFRAINGCRKHLSEWLPWVENTIFEKNTLDFILSRKRAYKDGKGLTFVILLKGKIVGVIGYNSLVASTRSGEIGYWLIKKFTGQGIMSKCCQALVAHGFDTIKLHRIVIRCAVENQKSCAIPERLNFKYEGTLRDSAKLKGKYISLRLFSQLSTEYHTLKSDD